jgi:hypothetical protein
MLTGGGCSEGIVNKGLITVLYKARRPKNDSLTYFLLDESTSFKD